MGREYLNSLELYNNYRNGHFTSSEQDFVYEITNAILNEYQTKGFSPYMDSIRGGRKLDYIEHVAITAVFSYYKDGKEPQMRGEKYFQMPERLEMLSRNFLRMIGGSSVIYRDQSNLSSILAFISKRGRKQHLEYIESLKQANNELEMAVENASGELERERILQQARAEAEKILNAAREAARQLKADAEDDAEDIKNNVREEIAALRSEAAEDNAREKEEAEKFALCIKRYAQEEADRIKMDANEEAKEIRREATEEMQAEKENVKRGSERTAQKLIDKNIRQYQAESRREVMSELNQYYQNGEEAAREMKQMHVEMCDVTNGLQAAWMSVLDDTFAKMSELKADFYQKLGDWQKALYPSSYKALAERYVELYRVLNIDKTIRLIIQEENKKAAQNYQEEEKDVPVSETVRALQKLDSNLKVSLKKLESTLNGFGLYIFYPEKGEEYNEVLHSPYDEELYGELIVEECIVPGVMMKRMRGFEDEIVKQALVSLREKEPENLDFEE